MPETTPRIPYNYIHHPKREPDDDQLDPEELEQLERMAIDEYEDSLNDRVYDYERFGLR